MGNAGSSAEEFAPWRDETAEPLIRFENVTKRYGSFVAIDNLSLDIYEREFFALLGASGSGKTTLLRLLAGLEKPSSGRILIDGRNMSRIPPHQRPVNMMFQSHALFPHMSVMKNIAFGLKQEGRRRKEIKSRVANLLGLLDLEAVAKSKPHQLTVAQQQRVALARTLAKGPKLLLLDEPLGVLDKPSREQTQFELMDIRKKLDSTFIVVTHDQQEAMTVASRIAVMDKGRVAQVDVPADIYEKPRSRFVAGFIGDVNSFECSVLNVGVQSPSGRGLTVTTASSAGQIGAWDNHVARGLLPNDKVWLGIRPEKITVSKTKPVSEPNQHLNMVQGDVFDITYSGNMSTYHVRLDDESVIRAQSTNHRRLQATEINREDKVWLSWPITASIVLQD